MELPDRVDPPPKPNYPIPLAVPPAINLEAGQDHSVAGVCMLVAGVLPQFGQNLPSPQELRLWDRPSQVAYWEQRRAAYNRLKMTELQRVCRQRQIWPGGDLSHVKDRLMRHDWGGIELCVHID